MLSRNIRRKFQIALITYIMTGGVLSGQSESQEPIDLEEVVITGSKTERPIGNVTQKVDVISSNELQTTVTGQNNIAEIIALRPGAAVSALSRNDANWGTFSGIGPKYSTFMVNGLPIDAFTDPMNLETMAFERIEIQRGPASVLYPNYLSQDFAGNQSPLAGTINLITRKKIDTPLSMASLSYGSYNTLNGQLFHQNNHEKLHYFAGVNYETSDYTNYGTEDSWLNMQKEPEYEKRKVYAGSTWFYGDNEEHRLTTFFNHTNHKGDAGRVYRGFDHNYTTINVQQSSQLNSFMTLNAGLGFRIYDRNWQESDFNETDELVSQNGAFQRILPADVNLTINHGNNHSFIIGADYQNASYHNHSDPLQGYKLYGNKSRSMQYGVYAQEELYLDRLILRGGLRYNHIRNIIDLIEGGNPGDGKSTWNRLLFNAGIKYHLSAFIELYGNVGNSFMAPGLKSIGGTIPLSAAYQEGFHGQLPNPDLKPESGLGVDVGTTIYTFMGIKLGARGFYHEIDDAIIDVRVSEDPSQSQSINAETTISSGFEIELEQTISEQISWFINYTSMKTEIENKEDPAQDGATVPFSPEKVLNLGFAWSSQYGFTIRPVLNYTSEYYDSSSLENRIKFKPGYLFNLHASQIIANNQSTNVELFTNFYNITNNKFEMPWQFRNTGFSMMAGIRVRFQ